MVENGGVEASVPLPYGEQQGSFMGVVAFSNRDDGFFSGEANYLYQKIYTGYRYQCVEYARRFLILTTGCVFGSCGGANEIFEMKTLKHIETDAKLDFIAHPNGKSKRRPTPGDIIVYPRHSQLLPWGHVGVISYVHNQKVGIAEQNYSFSLFTSPDPGYLGGERCVSRYLDLELTADGSWQLRERQTNHPDCLGWMSYPRAPRRSAIHEPLKVPPEQRRVRATPLDQEDHPCLWRFALPEDKFPFRSLYVFRHGTGEALIGAVTAFSRIVRVTLEFLFNRCQLSAGFAALLSSLPGPGFQDIPKKLKDIIEAAANEDDNDALMEHAIAAYFSLPEDVIAAMRREFRLAMTHMSAHITYRFNLAADVQKQLESGVEMHCLKAVELHDEAWVVENVNFGNPWILSELSVALASNRSCQEFLWEATRPEAICMIPCEFRMDFLRYVKHVEKMRGSRTGFTIIKSSSFRGDDADKVTASILSFCEAFQYPTFVFDESRVWYDSEQSKLYGRSTTGANLHVDFCFCMTEWPDILSAAADSFEGKLEGRSALRQAATDPRADVVFAKPLWSLLCSGSVNRIKDGANDTSVKFFDISRCLYEFFLPKQPLETLESDLHEYRDSCRRCHLTSAPAPELISKSVRGETVMVDFAASCVTGREADGKAAGLMYLFL
ncbi:putative trypanothione synthetase-like protein [Trypanosoma cruzi]|nr:putative trypanothione synthetase-like protein [Trypanosoma cruzi]